MKGSNAFSAIFLNGYFNDMNTTSILISRKEWLRNVRNQMKLNETTTANKVIIPVTCEGEGNLATIVNEE